MDKLQFEYYKECMPKKEKHHMCSPMHCGKYRLAQAYVIKQPYAKLYSPCEALKRGTLFTNLYEPYK